jgi:hypothetical protein
MMSNDTTANDYVMSNNILTHMHVTESAAPISFTSENVTFGKKKKKRKRWNWELIGSGKTTTMTYKVFGQANLLTQLVKEGDRCMHPHSKYPKERRWLKCPKFLIHPP